MREALHHAAGGWQGRQGRGGRREAGWELWASPEWSSFTRDDMVLVMESAATSRSLRRFLLVPEERQSRWRCLGGRWVMVMGVGETELSRRLSRPPRDLAWTPKGRWAEQLRLLPGTGAQGRGSPPSSLCEGRTLSPPRFSATIKEVDCRTNPRPGLTLSSTSLLSSLPRDETRLPEQPRLPPTTEHGRPLTPQTRRLQQGQIQSSRLLLLLALNTLQAEHSTLGMIPSNSSGGGKAQRTRHFPQPSSKRAQKPRRPGPPRTHTSLQTSHCRPAHRMRRGQHDTCFYCT